MFGNPTMAYIDMQAFIQTNSAVLEEYSYFYMSNDSWIPNTENVNVERYLPPMRSVMLKAKSSAQSLELELLPEHLTLNPIAEYAEEDSKKEENPMPRRAGSIDTEVMTIYADVYGTKAVCMLASKSDAKNVYSSTEDALFFSSGVEEGVNSSTATSPVNMYTVSNQVPMMVVFFHLKI
jgi:hypothetical protein